MSFKREGNDGSWLRTLQKRRVSELLSEEIPEGEAHLMRNGKFACMVCCHRPVFDTVDMLSVHRNGKKHITSVEYRDAEREELDNLRRTRLHEEYLNTGEISSQLLEELEPQQKPSSSQLLGAKPYDPRVKRRPDRRRHMLDLPAMESLGTRRVAPKSYKSCLYNPESSNIGLESLDVPLTATKSSESHNNESMSLVHSNKEKLHPPQTISEYRKQKRLDFDNNKTQLKPYQRRKCFPSGISNTQIPHQLYVSKHLEEKVSSVSCGVQVETECSSMCDSVAVTASKAKHKTDASDVDPVAVSEKAMLNEKYLKALAAGWKKDRTGSWVKDDAVEFDSDEEPPELP